MRKTEGQIPAVQSENLDKVLISAEHLLNLIKGLSAVRTGSRVAYATSVSISDARELLSVAAQMVADYIREADKCKEREAHPMPKFVNLVTDDEATMLVNLETVTRIKDGDGGELTAIYFVGSEDHPLRVKESGQEILKRARAEW